MCVRVNVLIRIIMRVMGPMKYVDKMLVIVVNVLLKLKFDID